MCARAWIQVWPNLYSTISLINPNLVCLEANCSCILRLYHRITYLYEYRICRMVKAK